MTQLNRELGRHHDGDAKLVLLGGAGAQEAGADSSQLNLSPFCYQTPPNISRKKTRGNGADAAGSRTSQGCAHHFPPGTGDNTNKGAYVDLRSGGVSAPGRRASPPSTASGRTSSSAQRQLRVRTRWTCGVCSRYGPLMNHVTVALKALMCVSVQVCSKED